MTTFTTRQSGDARSHWRTLLNQVRGGEHVAITRYETDTAGVLVPPADYLAACQAMGWPVPQLPTESTS
jgi:hypothetical protein